MLPSAPLVRVAMRAARVLPASAYHALGLAAGTVAGWVSGSRGAVAVENMRHLRPTASGAEHRRMARSLFRNLFEAASDLFRLPLLSARDLRALVAIEGLASLEDLRHRGRGAIIVTPHLGPYELGGALLALLGFDAHAMVETLDPETNAALAAYRGSTGLTLISRNTGVRELYRVVSRGGFILLVADRVIGEGSDGVVVPFGDARRAVPQGPAALSIATGAPVVVGHIVRASGPHRYRVTFDRPLSPPDRERDAFTRTIGARLSELVQQYPEQWYVFQPDWLTA